ncbi:hypothetical protein [Mesorhizobium amorphae]|uniref:hypothetical protein n=1 Tax=Mesorhizobium amorphae TaxID=71433 RepID=UPI0016426200|nr:hypothetical protein [Mesorhizobium amorphae]
MNSKQREIPEDVLALIDVIVASIEDQDRARSSAEDMKKLLCEKYGIKKYCKGGVLS